MSDHTFVKLLWESLRVDNRKVSILVSKNRARENRVLFTRDGVTLKEHVVRSVVETMNDSSASGSARTEVGSIDAYLNKGEGGQSKFYRALQQENNSAGNVGLNEFVVNRVLSTYTPTSGTCPRQYGTKTTPWRRYTGFTMRVPGSSEFPSVTPTVAPSTEQLDAIGQGFYLSSLPNRDQADLGTTLAEIVSNPVRAMALPIKTVSRAAKGRGPFTSLLEASKARNYRDPLSKLSLEDARIAADDHLAYIFGVRPTVQSLDRLAESLTRSRQLAETVSRSGMKKMRRRRSHPLFSRSATKSTNPAITYHASTGNLVRIHGTRVARVETTRQEWFSASYRMSVNDTDTFLGRSTELFQTMDRLTGLGMDIKVCWDLIPFSFLADWFANTGDLLESRSIIADYNIACEYGYAMCHTRLQKTLVAEGALSEDGTNYGSSCSTSYSYLSEVKKRHACGSFGFKTDFESLNSFQWGALTALGLSFAPGIRPTTRS